MDSVEIGEEMRKLREKSGLKQFTVALRMGFTPPYVSDLELGKREWNNALIKRFKLAVKSNGGGIGK